jgi:hypothetical protein
LMEKSKNGETLTTEEQTKLDQFKANMLERWEWRWFWWKGWFNKIKQTENTSSSN